MSDAAWKPDAQAGKLPSVLLAGTSAIQDLVAERNRLRTRVTVLEQELLGLSATNEDLGRQIVLIGDSYRKLATEFVTQLHYIDNVIRKTDP